MQLQGQGQGQVRRPSQILPNHSRAVVTPGMQKNFQLKAQARPSVTLISDPKGPKGALTTPSPLHKKDRRLSVEIVENPADKHGKGSKMKGKEWVRSIASLLPSDHDALTRETPEDALAGELCGHMKQSGSLYPQFMRKTFGEQIRLVYGVLPAEPHLFEAASTELCCTFHIVCPMRHFYVTA